MKYIRAFVMLFVAFISFAVGLGIGNYRYFQEAQGNIDIIKSISEREEMIAHE